MYIYHTGAIGEAISAKIESTKNAVQGNGTPDDRSFRDVMHSVMEQTDTEKKVVGYRGETSESASKLAQTDGRTLMYAINNADSDDTAAAVINALGLSGVTGNNLKTDADSITSAAELLAKSASASPETIAQQLTEFTARFNSLLTDLRTRSTSSAYMYANLLRTAAATDSDTLAKAGITVDTDGKLTFDSAAYEELDIEGFLNSVTTAAGSISTYSSTISGSSNSGLLDFLGNDDSEDSTYSTAGYYAALMNTMI